VATILIADDNSNIQKMVALAFKNEGIDVVAVGNGEAAVRKAPEIMPDLVLADIFMPVRNGYEVCEFIKRDTRLAHVPVVLLAGAFDPFDEREAQRVGADGILKKPFVPPEPLVSLVKELLARSAAHHLVPVAAAPAASEVSTDIGTASQEAAKAQPAPPPAVFEVPGVQNSEDGKPFGGYPLADEPKSSGYDGGAAAFGSLLDAEEEEQAASRNPDRNHEDAVESETVTRPEEETIVEPLDRFSAAHFPAHVEAPVQVEPEPPTPEQREPGEESKPWSESLSAAESPAEPVPTFPPQLSSDDTQAFDPFRSSSMPWHSATSRVESSREAVGSLAEAPAESAPIPQDTNEARASAAENVLAPPNHNEETEGEGPVYEIIADALQELEPSRTGEEMATEPSQGRAESFPVPAPTPLDARQIEEIVSRVVERMQPQVLEVITREILRPVVEALVRRQLELK